MSNAKQTAKSLNRTAPVPSHSTFETARFVTPGQQRSTRAPIQLTVPSDQKFSVLSATSISFEIATPETLRGDYMQERKRKILNPHEDLDNRLKGSREAPGIDFEDGIESTSERQAKRPRLKKFVITRLRKPRLKLSTLHPVEAEPCTDVWRVIFQNVSPALLLELKTVCKQFNSLLEEMFIWKLAREKQYGTEMPSPPEGMSERKFGDLISGRGCQNTTCTRTKTGKVFWTFQVRLCDDCIRLYTLRGDCIDQLDLRHVHEHKLLDLLPAGKIFNGKYSGSRDYDSVILESWSTRSDRALFLTAQVKSIDQEYGQLISDGKTQDEILQWRVTKLEQSKAFIKKVGELESWDKDRNNAVISHRPSRITFFHHRAQQLVPPMDASVLNKMSAYKKSLETNRPPTERSWDTLKEKILPYRGHAEELVQFDDARQSRTLFHNTNAAATMQVDLHTKLRERRIFINENPRILQKEQEFVLTLARHELGQCIARSVQDPDIALMCLQNVFEKYQMLPVERRPRGMNSNGQIGPYILMLDDIRMIINQVIEPEVQDDPMRKHVVLESFKCKGCTRTDCNTRYNFAEGLDHIVARHSNLVGDDTYFHYFARPLPGSTSRVSWYTINWPPNLPLAASHHCVSSGRIWIPEAVLPYQQLKIPSTTSAFKDRSARTTEIPDKDFAENFAFAVEKLQKTCLDTSCQTKIALQYATDRFTQSTDQMPSFDHFTKSINLLHTRNLRLDLRFRCGACVNQGLRPRGAKYVRHPVVIHDLQEHWTDMHNGEEWTKTLMHLPNECELYDYIQETDDVLTQKKNDVRRAQAEQKKAAWKKPNAKATAILAVESAIDVFDQLFPRV